MKQVIDSVAQTVSVTHINPAKFHGGEGRHGRYFIQNSASHASDFPQFILVYVNHLTAIQSRRNSACSWGSLALVIQDLLNSKDIIFEFDTNKELLEWLAE
jgi:hypothetical protein